MVQSVLDDIKSTFRSGNMIMRIILINIGIYVIVNLISVFTPSGSTFYASLIEGLSIPGHPLSVLKQPWSILTHMFLHEGFWHILWNMLWLYWFGQILGDLLGDRKVLPIYLLGGLAGALVYVSYAMIVHGGQAHALGASAAVMAIVWATAMTSPDYRIHLLFLGAIKIKYIALVKLFFDIIGTAGGTNQGGYWAHIGGAVFGIVFLFLLRKGTDLTAPINGLIDKINDLRHRRPKVEKTPRSKFRVVHNKTKSDTARPPQTAATQQEELDRILDKIKAIGYDKLDDEEKDFLYRASKKS